MKNIFKQLTLNRFMNIKKLILKAEKKIDVSDEIEHLKLDFSGDFNP